MSRIDSLPILILYPHSRCNCRCVMCDIWKVTEAQEISEDDLERHADDIRALGVRWVVLSGGEPLMHSDLFRLCRLLRQWNVRISLLSTGLLLERHASSIAAHIDDVIVSLDGPAHIHNEIRRVPQAFEHMATGIAALRLLQPALPVAARCTVQRRNATALRETVEAARSLNLDSISFLAADLHSTAFNRTSVLPLDRQHDIGLTEAEIVELEHEIEALIVGHTPFVRESPEKLRRIVQHFRAHLGLEPAVAPRCNAPWVSAVLETDGTVRPCFFHAPIGSVREHSLRAVINSPEALSFRASLDVATNPVCVRCVCSLYLPEPRAQLQ